MVELVLENWPQLVTELMRWKNLLHMEWSPHQKEHMPGG